MLKKSIMNKTNSCGVEILTLQQKKPKSQARLQLAHKTKIHSESLH